MTRHIISALLLALLAPVAADAAPFAASPSYQQQQQQQQTRGMGWRDYYNARRESHWSKPIGHSFSKPFQPSVTTISGSRQQQSFTSFLRRPSAMVRQPGLDLVKRRNIASEAKLSPFTTNGGFGESVQRAMPEIRDGNWEARRGKLPSTVRVAKVTKTKTLHPRKTGSGSWKVNKGSRKPAPRHVPRPVRPMKPTWRVN